ncbi:MAG: 4-phosphoerythronate dehydrogenase [Proteobacteria bacterium]|nr:4-phosphoerythronate dehydrogenase [Pseudomonadota bacterium]
MKIAVDCNIPYGREAFSTLGDVALFEQSEITNRSLAPFDALIIRSTCKVDVDLLKHRNIRFVGSTTIGFDHIDRKYLTQQGITFSSAPGCNAEAVGEFVINAILSFLKRDTTTINDQCLGIIGMGNTGSALNRKAGMIGLQTCLCDPLLQQIDKDTEYLSFEQTIKKATILSFHVPLTTTGSHPTYHLLNDRVMQLLTPNTTLINTSRGEVFDQRSVLKYRNKLKGLILDVWENEPGISVELLNITDIATPHIAGYSIQGKLKATEIIYKKYCRFLQQSPSWNPQTSHHCQERIIDFSKEVTDLSELLKLTYDIYQDDADLRAFNNSQSLADRFKSLRDNYTYRSEFGTHRIKHPGSISKDHLKTLQGLGFSTVLSNI